MLSDTILFNQLYLLWDKPWSKYFANTESLNPLDSPTTASIIIIPILLERKLKLREGGWLVQGSAGGKGG